MLHLLITYHAILVSRDNETVS